MAKYIFGVLALAIFALFATDMLAVNYTNEPFLTRVQAFLALAAACVCFVIMILLFEQDSKGADNTGAQNKDRDQDREQRP